DDGSFDHHLMGAFFFSSRRRHTRLQGDWSSDVCSSDLYRNGRSDPTGVRSGPSAHSDSVPVTITRRPVKRPTSRHVDSARRTWRSEERRVGKESRSRCSGRPYRKNNATIWWKET